MCWNKEVSIITFLIASVGIIYLYQRNGPNDRWIALFAGVIALIQLAEYFMWSDQSCGETNRIASIFAMLVLILEPIANVAGGLWFSDNSNKQFLKIILAAYLIFLLYAYKKNIHGNPIDFCGINYCADRTDVSFWKPTRWSGCHLKWNFLDRVDVHVALMWTFFLLIPFLAMNPKIHGFVLAAAGVLTCILSRTINNPAAGSLWCWFAISIIFIKILM